jgi:hypothetical protein
MWEPGLLKILCASKACYRDSFHLPTSFICVYIFILILYYLLHSFIYFIMHVLLNSYVRLINVYLLLLFIYLLLHLMVFKVFLATDPEVLLSISGPTRFSEK